MARLERIKQMKTLEELVNPKWFCKELFGDSLSDKNILIRNLCGKQDDEQRAREEAKRKEEKEKSINLFDWLGKEEEKPFVYIFSIYQKSFWYGENFLYSYFEKFLTEKLEKIDSIDDFTFLTDSVENKELVEFLQENEINIKDTEKVKDNLKYIIFFIATLGNNDGVNRGKKRKWGDL